MRMGFPPEDFCMDISEFPRSKSPFCWVAVFASLDEVFRVFRLFYSIGVPTCVPYLLGNVINALFGLASD